jgi:hypothetical protein
MILLTAFMLLGSVGAFAGKASLYKTSDSKSESSLGGVDYILKPVKWTQTSSCGIPYSVSWECYNLCVQNTFTIWQMQQQTQVEIDAACPVW